MIFHGQIREQCTQSNKQFRPIALIAAAIKMRLIAIYSSLIPLQSFVFWRSE